MKTSVTITGVDTILRDLDAIRVEALRADVAAILREVAADAGDYSKAPERPGQKYVRSGDLGSGWTDAVPVVDVRGDAIDGRVENDVSYAPWVQGAEDQTAVFAGRWRTDDQVADAWEDRIAARVEAALERVTS